MLLRSSFAIGFFTVLMGLSLNVWQFFAARALMGAFAGFSASAIALVASQVPEQRLGYALGWLSTGQLVGGLVGPVLGGGLADATGSFRVPFYCTAAICFGAMRLAWAVVRERFVPPAQPRQARSAWSGPRLLTALVGSGVAVLRAAAGAIRRAHGAAGGDPVRAGAGAPQANLATLAGFAFSVTGVADLLASPFLGKRSDVIGYRRVLLICLLGAAAHQPAAGVCPQLLGISARAVRRRLFHRRHPADGQCAGRADGAAGAARHGVRPDRVRHVSRQFPGAADRWRRGRLARAAFRVPGHRRAAARESRLGLSHRPGIRGRAEGVSMASGLITR